MSGVFSPGGGYFELSATQRVIGSDAGANNTGDNVFLAMAGAGDNNIGDDVIAIGISAAENNEAADVIAIGSQAAQNLLNGSGGTGNNGTIAIGADALRDFGAGGSDTNQRDMLVIGNGALAQLDNANSFGMTVIGQGALPNDFSTNVVRTSVVIGTDIGATLSNPVSQSVAIGYEAYQGSSAFTQMQNDVWIGYRAGLNAGTNTTGNVGIGSGVLQGIGSSAAGLVAVGFGALSTNGAAINNTAIGSGAGNGITGNSNTVVGSDADGGTATAQVVIGGSAGVGSGSRSGAIIIGRLAGRTNVNHSQPFVLESNPTASTGAARPTPFLYGDLANANLLLGQHIDGSSNPTGRTFPQATGPVAAGPLLGLQDAANSAGGVATPTIGASGMAALFYDSTAGANGELRAIDPAGTIVTVAAF